MKTTTIRKGISCLSMAILAVIGAAILFIEDVSPAQATVIVSDNFSGGEGDPVNGRTPGVNLPGGTWYSVGSGNNPFGAAPIIQGNTALGTVNSSAYISISDNLPYTKPTQLIISGDLRVGNLAGNNLGVGLGFNDDKTVYAVNQEISLGANGDLNFNQTLIAPYDAVNFGGNSFEADNFYHLSYTVDTSTGGVSNITLSNGFGSQSYTLTTNAFTNAETAFAGFFTNSSALETSGSVDNFMVETVPEPNTFVLLLGMSSALVRTRRHRSAGR